MSRYFIRVRGRVRGPYDIDRLKLLHARGQFSRVHQVSTDGSEWSPAAILAQVFDPDATPDLVQDEDYEEEPPKQWYYQKDGQSHGPVPDAELHRMVTSGELASSDLVCEVGATEWSVIDPGGDKRRSRTWNFGPLGTTVIALLGVVALSAVGIVAAMYFNPEINAQGLKNSLLADTAVTGPLDEEQIREAVGMVICGKRLVLHDGKEVEIPESLGSCFFISPDGYAITNSHVVAASFNFVKKPELLEDRRSATVKEIKEVVRVYIDGTGFDAEMIHNSERYDFAIIKIDRKDSPYFQLSTEEELERNTKVFAVGFPAAGMRELSTFEQIAKEFRQLTAKRFRKHFSDGDFVYNETEGAISRIVAKDGQGKLLQHTAIISKGNSGGPLIDESGVVVGVNTFRVDSGNVYFALSMAQLKKEIMQHAKTAIFR